MYTLTGTSRNTSGCKSCSGFPLKSRYLSLLSMKKLRCTSSTIVLSAKLRRRRSCQNNYANCQKFIMATHQVINVSIWPRDTKSGRTNVFISQARFHASIVDATATTTGSCRKTLKSFYCNSNTGVLRSTCELGVEEVHSRVGNVRMKQNKVKSKANWRQRMKVWGTGTSAIHQDNSKGSWCCCCCSQTKLKFKHVKLSFAPKSRQYYLRLLLKIPWYLLQSIPGSLYAFSAQTKLFSKEVQ